MERLSVSWINNGLSRDYPLTMGVPSILKEPSLKRWSSAISGAAGRQLPGWCTTGKRLVNYYTNPCWSLLIYSIILTLRKYRQYRCICIYILYYYILHIDDYILYTMLYYIYTYIYIIILYNVLLRYSIIKSRKIQKNQTINDHGLNTIRKP